MKTLKILTIAILLGVLFIVTSTTAFAATTGPVKIGGYYYVYDSSGNMLTDCYYANSAGQKFYLTSTGRALTGKKTFTKDSGAVWCMYFYGNGKVAISTFETTSSGTYYFSTDGNLRKNKVWKNLADNKYYYSDKYGKVCKDGWTVVGDYKYYFSKVSGRAVTGLKNVGGYYYMFDSTGKLQKNLYYANSAGQKFYFTSTGRALKGKKTFTKTTGSTYCYYFNGDGTILISKFGTTVSGTYYFSTDGNLRKNKVWKNLSDLKYYYSDKYGKICKDGWTVVGDYKYYFSKTTGRAVTGPKKVGDYYYVFDSTGKLLKDRFYANSAGQKFYLNGIGRAQIGFYSSDDEGVNTYYLNGDGTYKNDGLFTVEGKIYYVSSVGLVSKKGYRKIDGYFYYFDETTGEAITGTRIGAINGEETRCYFFDPTTETGYRTGKQEDGEDEWYFFSYTNGAAYARFFSDTVGSKVYYIDPDTFQIQMSGIVSKYGLTFLVNADGSLDLETATTILHGDSDRVKLLKYGFSQMFKPDGGTGLPNTTPFDDIDSYSCTEFVSRIYREIGIDLGTGDIIEQCYDPLEATIQTEVDASTEAGDIIFWNMTDCDTKEDGEGGYWIIDADEDGICDRIHDDNEFGDGIFYHVHHVSIYLGDGQLLDASSEDGITIRNIPEDTDTFYITAYANVMD